MKTVREPTPVDTLGGAIVAFANDPDGYQIENLQRPAARAPLTPAARQL